jgi:serine/threonine protein kinase
VSPPLSMCLESHSLIYCALVGLYLKPTELGRVASVPQRCYSNAENRRAVCMLHLWSLGTAELNCEPFPAIDVWAVGMILLFFLTGKFPLFQSNDDTEALMEIAVVIGRNKMEKAATLHSKPVAGHRLRLTQTL